ncbi:MAG: transposase [Okeania sp. SIO2F4]|nr:transposase [Okeania sp. SIO2F4]
MLEGKAEKYGRDLRVISRWELTSQVCSDCGFRGGKLDIQVREWECLNCGTKHDRNENAAINILVAGGQSETLNGRGGKRKTTVKVAAASVSGALRQQNVNSPRGYGSVGISVPASCLLSFGMLRKRRSYANANRPERMSNQQLIRAYSIIIKALTYKGISLFYPKKYQLFALIKLKKLVFSADNGRKTNGKC